MRILVPLKRVADPDNANKIKVSPAKIDTAGLEFKPNPFDEYAVETALRLTENGTNTKARLGEVVVVTFGPKETETTLRAALATGADRAIRVDATDEQLDGDLVARALKALVDKEKPDLVLLGKQEVEADANQVGQLLAEYLGWPQATFAGSIKSEGDKALVVGREIDGGTLNVKVTLPAVVTVDLRIVAPTSVSSMHSPGHKYADGVRFAALMAIMGAKKKPLAEHKLADLAADATLKTKYTSFEAPAGRKAGIKIKTVQELVAKLKTEAKVLKEKLMSQVLVIAELSSGKVKKSTHSAITFARTVAKEGGSFAILAIGAGAKAAAAELTGFGASKVLVVDDASLEHQVCELFAPTIADVAKKGNFDTLAFTASSFGKDVAPRVAAKLGAGYASDVASVNAAGGKQVYKRPMFAGNAYGHCEITTPVKVVSVRQSEFPAAEPSGGASPVETATFAGPDAAAARVAFVSLESGKSERPDLGEARVVVSGGRALKERFAEVLDPLASLLGAAVGASRAACDAGYAPAELQVGQTGRVVAPQLYFAIGISGAIQHLAGMKSSKTIVAINKDPDAPIFQVADYGLVADLFVAVPELITELKKEA